MRPCIPLFLLTLQLHAGIFCGSCEGLYIRVRSAVKQFQKQTGYPKGRKDWVVDHIVPLDCAKELKLSKPALDVPENMQWQHKFSGRLKDKWERRFCKELADNPKFEPFCLIYFWGNGQPRIQCMRLLENSKLMVRIRVSVKK